MAWFGFNKEKEDIEKDAPGKTGAALGLSTIWRELRSLITLNFMMDVFCVFPLLLFMSVVSGWPAAVSIAFLVLSVISLICLPAAITAENRITVTMVRDENFFLWQDFTKAFRKNFGKALLGGLVFVLLLTAFVFAGFVYYFMFGQSVLFSIILAFDACLVLVTFTASLYFWPMLAYVDLPFNALFKNSLILVLGSWKRSLLAWLAELGTILFLLFMKVDIIMLLLGFIVVSVNSLLVNFAVYPSIYDRVIRKNEHETKSYAVGADQQELKWDDAEELQSASIDDLDFGSDDKEE